MQNFVKSDFSRNYNPRATQNVLSDLKRMLTSRDTANQNKACVYLTEVINRYNKNATERAQVLEYLLENDITVFLCEATTNLDLSLFRSILQIKRLLWRDRRFFAEEHAAHSMTAVLRALTNYAGSGSQTAIDTCLHFLCDLFNGISCFKTASALSHQSAYSVEQLLSCLKALAPRITTIPNSMLSSALVVNALISYQPADLDLRSNTCNTLLEILNQWLDLLMCMLNHSTLVGDKTMTGMFFVVTCQIGMDVLRLINLVNKDKQTSNFIQTILIDQEEIQMVKQCSFEMEKLIQRIMSELIIFTKENQSLLTTEDYSVFLKFLLVFLNKNFDVETKINFCELLLSKGYLTMLPKTQIIRNDIVVRKVSILVLGEMLKGLAKKYLDCENNELYRETCSRHIHMGLTEIQYGIEKVGTQLQKSEPYSLLIYIYFFCQSSEKPEKATALLLPHLVEHILQLPKLFKPPPYIIKALWLVFSMSTISNGSLEALDERLNLEKANDRLVAMLQPQSSAYYTHNPALLLWAFTSKRIPNYIRLQIVLQWLKIEAYLPHELSKEPILKQLLLNILIQDKNEPIVQNCIKALHLCLENGDDEAKEDFARLLWSLLPRILSKALINCAPNKVLNICQVLELATALVPLEVKKDDCYKIAVLVTALYVKKPDLSSKSNECRCHYEYVCLKLSLYLLGLSHNQNDSRVLLLYINRNGFLSNVLTASHSLDEKLACAALQFLSYSVYYFTKNKYQPQSILEIQTDLIVKSLREDSASKRGVSLLQLVYMVLNSHSTPLVLSHELETKSPVTQQCGALRALMFRIQMLCCRESTTESSAGWKTLSSILKHAIISKHDPKLVATLTAQPWTHTLIGFQMTQNWTQEFLTFTHTWLNLLKITLNKNREISSVQIFSQNLVFKTLNILNTNLTIEQDFVEEKQNILAIVKEILEASDPENEMTQ